MIEIERNTERNTPLPSKSSVFLKWMLWYDCLGVSNTWYAALGVFTTQTHTREHNHTLAHTHSSMLVSLVLPLTHCDVLNCIACACWMCYTHLTNHTKPNVAVCSMESARETASHDRFGSRFSSGRCVSPHFSGAKLIIDTNSNKMIDGRIVGVFLFL